MQKAATSSAWSSASTSWRISREGGVPLVTAYPLPFAAALRSPGAPQQSARSDRLDWSAHCCDRAACPPRFKMASVAMNTARESGSSLARLACAQPLAMPQRRCGALRDMPRCRRCLVDSRCVAVSLLERRQVSGESWWAANQSAWPSLLPISSVCRQAEQ